MAEPTLTLIEDFKGCFLEITEAVIKLRELERLRKLGEVSKGASDSLRNEYMENLLKYCKRFVELENEVDAARAKVLVELESSRKELVERGLQDRGPRIERQEAYLRKIESAYFSINVQTGLEAFQCIASMQFNKLREVKPNQHDELCQPFLDSLAKGWFYQKERFKKHIEPLEKRIDELEKQENELTLRIRVGEIAIDSKENIEREMSTLKGKVSEATNFINVIDSRIFDCYLILTGQGSGPSFDTLEIPADLLYVLDVNATIEVDGKVLTVEDAYYSVLYRYSLGNGFGSMAAKDRLERDIKMLTDKGLSRSGAIASLLKQSKGGRQRARM